MGLRKFPTSGDGIAVSIRGLKKTYANLDAVKNLSIDIGDGEFFSILGPSGCGKTTTLKCVGGFIKPTAGSIFIHGEEVQHLPPYRRNVNTVFQNYALFPHLTVIDNVAFGLKMQGVAKKERRSRAAEALESVQLLEMAERNVTQLSGGQQQRVALARALVNRPAVLLLDEPLGALDLKLRKDMQAELKEIQRNTGLCFIYVTHDQEEALTMSDRVAVMRDGEMLQVASPVEIYERPTTRFVADFIGESSFLAGSVSGREGEIAIVDVPNIGEYRVVAPEATPGMPLVIGVRPENVHLHAVNGEVGTAANRVRARVESALYAGGETSYVLRATDGTPIRARLHHQPGEEAVLFAEGSEVLATFDVQSAIPITDRAEGVSEYNQEETQ